MGRFANFLLGERVDSHSPPPYLLRIRSSKIFILTTICLAVFTDIFLYGISKLILCSGIRFRLLSSPSIRVSCYFLTYTVVPVIPFAIESRAGVAPSSVQSWVSVLLACYGAALLVLSPIAGWYADRSSSRRLPLLFGLLALSGATVMLCLARTVALLVVGRLLQGFSAAIVWVVGMALLVDTVGEKEIGETLGWVSISMSVGILLAPLLGGIVYNKAGYYAVYYMAFALIGLDIFLRLSLIEKKIARQWLNDEEPDSGGVTDAEQGCSGADVTTDEKANVAEPKDGDTVESAVNPTTTSLAPIPQTRSKWPPVLTLLKSRRLLTALWGCIAMGSQMTAFDTVIPLYVQHTFHWDSIGAGLIFLAVFIPGFAAPRWAADKYGPRWPTVIGFTMAIPFWILLRLITHDTLGQKILLCALLALIGISLTLTNPPLMAEITYVVEAKEKQDPGRFGANGAYAQAYGLFIMAFAAGTLIGPVWSGYVEQAAGWGTMAWSLALLSFAGAVPCFIWMGGLVTEDNAKSGVERATGKVKPGESGVEVYTVG